MEAKTANPGECFDPAGEDHNGPSFPRNFPVVADRPPVTLPRPHTACVLETLNKSNSSVALRDSREIQVDEAGEPALSNERSSFVTNENEGDGGCPHACRRCLEHLVFGSRPSLTGSYDSNAATASKSGDQVSFRPCSCCSNQSGPFTWNCRENHEIHGPLPGYPDEQTAVRSAYQHGRTSSDETSGSPPKQAPRVVAEHEKVASGETSERSRHRTCLPVPAGSDAPVGGQQIRLREWDPETQRHRDILFDRGGNLSVTRRAILTLFVVLGLIATIIMVVLLSKWEGKRMGRAIFLTYSLVMEVVVMLGMIAWKCNKPEVLIALNLVLVAGIYITAQIDVLLGFSS